MKTDKQESLTLTGGAEEDNDYSLLPASCLIPTRNIRNRLLVFNR